MNCPYCASSTKVTNSRSRAKSTQVWRRRKCTSCNSIWSTHEVIDLSTSHKIEDHQGHLQAFSRDKLYSSIKDSLQHRKSATEDATALTATILTLILALNSPKLKTTTLKDISIKAISAFDPVAGAVYKAKRP